MKQGGEPGSSTQTETTKNDQGRGHDVARDDDLLEEALEESFPASNPIAANRFD